MSVSDDSSSVSLLPSSVSRSVFVSRVSACRQAAQLPDDGKSILLIVTGSDGNSSPACHLLVQWLFGVPHSTLAVLASNELSSNGTTDMSSDYSELDNLIVAIHRDGIRIYCHRKIKRAIEWITNSVRGVEIFCRESHCERSHDADVEDGVDDEEEDPEADEEELFKIHSFIAITQSFSRVFIPTMSLASASDADIALRNALEQWPLVQAYGLDEMGAHGFFTLTHQVSAFELAPIVQTWNQVDSSTLLHLVSSRVPILSRHFESTLRQLLACSSDVSSDSARDTTVKQINQEIRFLWEYGLESLPASHRAARLAETAPSVEFFGPAGLVDVTSEKKVRESGLKHYSSMQQYYNRLLSAQPYLPLLPLLPSLPLHSSHPLHALVSIRDPLSQVSACRTVLLRQVTQDQENEVEVFEFLVPDGWKRKKQRIVATAVGEESDPDAGSEDEDYPSSSSSSESEVEEAEESDDEEEERKSPKQKPKKKEATPKAAKPVPARAKKESPGLKDAQLLHFCYSLLIQMSQDLLRSIADAKEQAVFPSYSQLQTQAIGFLSHLNSAKWILPRYFDAVKQQTQFQPNANVHKDMGFHVALYQINAAGQRIAVNLTTPHILQPLVLYSFEFRLNGIPSRELLSLMDDDTIVGAVGFGESFLFDPIPAALRPAINSKSSMTEEEQAEEKRRKEDPRYFGTGLTSSSATDATASSAASNSAVQTATGSSLIVLTASIPSQLVLPSYFQLYETKALAALLGSYAHASAPGGMNNMQEILAAGLVPVHPSLGRFVFDSSVPRLGENLLALPPRASVAEGVQITIRDNRGVYSAATVSQRMDALAMPLLFYPQDHFLSHSPLAFSSTLLTSCPLFPVLQGSFVFFEKGFVFTGASVGSIVVDFQKHVLESVFYDGSGEEWPHAAGADGNESDDGDDLALEDEPFAVFDSRRGGSITNAGVDEEEDDVENEIEGDALFSVDLLEPHGNDAISSPYTLLNSLDAARTEKWSKLSPIFNNGVSAPPSRFAKASFSLAIVLPKASAFRRAFLSVVQGKWKSAMEELNIHNDQCDEIPAFCRHSYNILQEQHAQQRREVRKSKRSAGSAARTNSGDALVLPDATCDFFADLKLRELIRLQSNQNDGALVQKASTLFSALASQPTARKLKANNASASAATSSCFPVSIVVGAPGAFHTELLQCVRDASSKLGASSQWMDCVIVTQRSDRFDEAAAQQSIKSALTQMQQIVASKSQKSLQQRLLIAIVTYEGIIPVVNAVQSILTTLAIGIQVSLPITSVTTLLHANSFFVGPSFSLTVPYVTDQLVAGWSTSCLLVTPSQHLSANDEACVNAVRRRIQLVAPSVPLIVRPGRKRIAYADVEDMLSKERFNRPVQQERRLRYQLSHYEKQIVSKVLTSGPSLFPTVTHFFILPRNLLLHRKNFVSALLSFTRRRMLYHTDEERQVEADESAELLQQLQLGGGSSQAQFQRQPGRITFTTSDESLPARFNVLHVVALLAFEDSVTDSGSASASMPLSRFVEARASNGRLLQWQQRQFGATQDGSQRTTQVWKDEIDEDEADDDQEEKKASSSSTSSSVPTTLPWDALPIEVRGFLQSPPASSSPSSSSALSSSGGSFSTNVACGAIVVYGSSGLTRADVVQELLLPAVKAPREYEKPDSLWNQEVQQQKESVRAL